MALGMVFRQIFKLLVVAFGWALISTIAINLFTNGNMFRRMDIALYTVLTMFSYLGAISLALFASRIAGHIGNRFTATLSGVIVFISAFFVIQLVSAEIYGAFVEVNDGSINVNYGPPVLPRIDYP